MPNRFKVRGAIMDDYYANGLDDDGNELPQYAGVEDREMRIYDLAEAGDALENYLTQIKQYGESDPDITGMIALIDSKIEGYRRVFTPDTINKIREQLLERAIA